jgi:hypothetical protein
MLGNAGFMMKLNMLEIHNKVSPKLQPWFRQSREGMFKTKLEEVTPLCRPQPPVLTCSCAACIASML